MVEKNSCHRIVHGTVAQAHSLISDSYFTATPVVESLWYTLNQYHRPHTRIIFSENYGVLPSSFAVQWGDWWWLRLFNHQSKITVFAEKEPLLLYRARVSSGSRPRREYGAAPSLASRWARFSVCLFVRILNHLLWTNFVPFVTKGTMVFRLGRAALSHSTQSRNAANAHLTAHSIKKTYSASQAGFWGRYFAFWFISNTKQKKRIKSFQDVQAFWRNLLRHGRFININLHSTWKHSTWNTTMLFILCRDCHMCFDL